MSSSRTPFPPTEMSSFAQKNHRPKVMSPEQYDVEIAARDISPIGDIEFEGAFFDADEDGRLIVDFPTMTGSIEVGAAGATQSGIMLNGQQAARLVLNDWNVDFGVMTVRAH